jgi:hypothetical protein
MWAASVGVMMYSGFTVLSESNLMFLTVDAQMEPYAGELLVYRSRGETLLVRHERKSSLAGAAAGMADGG